MFQSMRDLVPAEWSGAYDVLSAPLAWIPAWHSALLNFAWFGQGPVEVAFKRALLLMPIMLLIAAMWCTMISMYTLPFRSGRGGFLTLLLSAWWDAGRTIWFFWAGGVRVAVLLFGWLWGGLRLLGSFLRSAFRSPMNFMDWTARSYFKPGVPWLAFIGLLVWSAVEALIFSYTLRPTMSEVLAGMTGYDPDPRLMVPILWFFLFFLVLGSFACVQALGDAIKARNMMAVAQMGMVELFVIFFEVLFLYREMIDALTPWIAQQSSEQVLLGLWSTLALATFGWVGVRGMTWFLFGRYGTPALIAVLGRETVKQHTSSGTEPAAPSALAGFEGPIAALKKETAWFHAEARRLFEYLSLPVLQLLAAAVNFAVVAIASRPMFELPFNSLDEVLAATPGRGSGESKRRNKAGGKAASVQLQGGAAQ